LRDMNFVSSQADPDVWIRAANAHYELLLVYVDDILIFAKNPKSIMDALGQLYELKPDSEKETDLYLGVNVEKFRVPNGRTEWCMSSR
jgi:hypothetical protein